jgi:hypothetical protein
MLASLVGLQLAEFCRKTGIENGALLERPGTGGQKSTRSA